MFDLDLLRAPARQAGSLDETSHRPWPLPEGGWLIGQSWDGLLFAHWRVDGERLGKLLPTGLELEEHDGSAWLGITPFLLSGFRLRGTLPLPLVSSFPELNVRTYVTAGGKPGIWFFSLDTSSLVAVEAARRFYKLPYFHARISIERGARIAFSSSRRGEAGAFLFDVSYGAAGEVFEPQPGMLEHFLTERYCLYASDREGLHRAEIHHPVWRISEAAAEIRLNQMAPEGIELEGDPMLHLAERQDVVIWPLEPA